MISVLVNTVFGPRQILKTFQARTAPALHGIGFREADTMPSAKASVRLDRKFELVELDQLLSIDLFSSDDLQKSAKLLGHEAEPPAQAKVVRYSLVFTAKVTRRGNVGDLALSRHCHSAKASGPDKKLLLRVLAPIHYFDAASLSHFVRRALLAIGASETSDVHESRWFVHGLSVSGLNRTPYSSDLPYIFPERHTTEARYIRWAEELLSNGYPN